ncbi:MAG TPA: phenylalanine--tRNA ligase subunit beta [Patescibacteria group bacterium]|nr:phenylalanine--tRNA ligase subunit beta [Patescibacteria group bacterium]
MKFSYNWLKQLVDFNKTPQELADDLSCKSIEIENIEKFGGDFLDTIVVGQILEINKHPNADKLQITKTDIGSQTLQIVCGAPNIAVGQKVPVALIGTKLPMGEIKQAKIRDIESFGMLCAQDELGIGNDHTGIMILDPDLPLGKKLSEIYGDWVLDGNILSNRGDLQNHMQLAREIGAIYGKEIKEIQNIENWKLEIENSGPVDVQINNLEACPLYTAQAIKGIKIGPSPTWMQQKLLACGMKPINNVVDITNYVMLEYGNPLHAFDAKKIPTIETQGNYPKKHQIVVRLSKKGEVIRTLDGQDHELPEELLVIADHEKPIAVAGVMGGENSEIDETTSIVILESANFNQKYIRKSQRELGLATEASSRFAKDLSPYLAFQCLQRAAELLVELASGELIGGPVKAGAFSFEKRIVKFDYEKIRNYLSMDISKEESIKILKNLGFEIDGNDISVPLWRKDVGIWQDIAEEVGRIYGLDRSKEHELSIQIEPKTEKALYFEQSAKKYLASLGLTEIYTLSILSSETAEKSKILGHYFEISNPMNEYDYIMRSSLVPGLLAVASNNAKKFERFSFFELSKIYLPSDKEEAPSRENRMLSLLVYGEKNEDGILILKNYIDHFAGAYGLNFQYENDAKPKEFMHPGRCAKVIYKEEVIGNIFEVHPIVSENLDLKNRCCVAEINFEAFVDDALDVENRFAEEPSEVIYKEFSRFEVSKRDIAVVVDVGTNTIDIIKEIKNTDEKVVGAELFDEYVSDKFGAGKKSVAYHLTFQASDRTLNDTEANELFDKVLKILSNKFNAELRR